MSIVIQIGLGIILSNIVEVLAHKYVLHGLGKKKNSFFQHHWNGHHRSARKNKFYDPLYLLPFWNWEHRAKEILGILVLDVLFLPFWFYFQIFTITLWLYSILYLVLHRYMHLHPEFAKKYFKNHVKHHLLDQNKYWGVLLPWVDKVIERIGNRT